MYGDSVVTVAPKRLPQALFLERIPKTYGDSVVTVAPKTAKCTDMHDFLERKKGLVKTRPLWSSRPDLNRRPARYECAALPTEPRKHILAASNALRKLFYHIDPSSVKRYNAAQPCYFIILNVHPLKPVSNLHIPLYSQYLQARLTLF